MVVSASSGVLDHPDLKERMSIDWADEHGKIIDLSEKFYKEREITLDCWLKADGEIDFMTKMLDFQQLFDVAGLLQLRIEIDPNKPLVYMVYLDKGVAIKKKWRSGTMVGTFQLKLVEPEPFKMVIEAGKLPSYYTVINFTITSSKPLTIYWNGTPYMSSQIQDKISYYNNLNQPETFNFSYPLQKIYYPVITGDISAISGDLQISAFSKILWNKL